MSRSNYKNSKKRLVLLLVQLAIIVYTVMNGTYEAKLLAALISPLWLAAAMSWRSNE